MFSNDGLPRYAVWLGAVTADPLKDAVAGCSTSAGARCSDASEGGMDADLWAAKVNLEMVTYSNSGGAKSNVPQ